MDLVAWKHLLQRRHLIVVPHHLRILELLSLLADELVDLLQFLKFLLGEADDVASVHHLLLLPHLLHDVVVHLDVLKVLSADAENLLEDLLCLGLLAFLAGLFYLLEHVPFLIVLEAMINNPLIDLLAVRPVRMIGEDPHDGDVEDQPIVHVGGLRWSDVELVGLVGIVLDHGLTVDVDAADLRVDVLQVAERCGHCACAEVQSDLQASSEDLQILRHKD